MALDLSLRGLRCMVAVAEEGSFSKAAQRLRLSQPTISAHIVELEKRAGMALFTRTTRRVVLTREGAEMLAEARRLIRDDERLERTVNRIRRQGSGRLRLGAAIYTIFIDERVDLIDRFATAHGDIQLDIVNAWQNELMRDLADGTIDMTIAVGRAIPAWEFERLAARRANGELEYPDDLPRIVLRTAPVRLLVPRESPLAAMDEIPPEVLKGAQVATLADEHGRSLVRPVTDWLEGAGAEIIAPPEGNTIAIERYAAKRRICAIGTGWLKLDGAADMVLKPMAGLDLSTDLVLLSAPGTRRPAAQMFWDLAGATVLM